MDNRIEKYAFYLLRTQPSASFVLKLYSILFDTSGLAYFSNQTLTRPDRITGCLSIGQFAYLSPKGFCIENY